MLKKTIEYEDYNGEKCIEEFYFNLSKAELAEMELSESGGLSTKLKQIMNTRDVPSIVKVLKEVILKSYGVPTADGKRFEKSEKLSTDFSQTEAYSELFMELAGDADKAAAFINGIVPPMPEDHKPATV